MVVSSTLHCSYVGETACRYGTQRPVVLPALQRKYAEAVQLTTTGLKPQAQRPLTRHQQADEVDEPA